MGMDSGMMSHVCNNVAMFEYCLRQRLSFVDKITLLYTSSNITYELWNVKFIRWCCCRIATSECYGVTIEKIVVEFSLNC
jgi:hypothetical protein